MIILARTQYEKESWRKTEATTYLNVLSRCLFRNTVFIVRENDREGKKNRYILHNACSCLNKIKL